METFSMLLALCVGNPPVTCGLKKASDAELWCFLWSTPEQTVETPLRSLLRYCDVVSCNNNWRRITFSRRHDKWENADHLRACYSLPQHIGVETNCSPICGHFDIHFLGRQLLFFIWIRLKFSLMRPNYNIPGLVQTMNKHRTSDKLLSKQMLTDFTDA